MICCDDNEHDDFEALKHDKTLLSRADDGTHDNGTHERLPMLPYSEHSLGCHIKYTPKCFDAYSETSWHTTVLIDLLLRCLVIVHGSGDVQFAVWSV